MEPDRPAALAAENQGLRARVAELEVSLKDLIELAILAERERCAQIAESHPGACQTGCETGEEIAERIREAKTWCCRSKALPHGQN